MQGANHAEWDQIRRRIHRLREVYWVKAHLKDSEVREVAYAKGQPEHWYAINRGADAQATLGMRFHQEDAGLLAY